MAARVYPAFIPLLLSFVAGYVDSCTFLALFGLFSAQVTGSFVIAGAGLVVQEQGVIAKVLAIPAFMVGAAAATLLVRAMEARVWAFRSALALQLVLMLVFLWLGLRGTSFTDADDPLAIVAALAVTAAMGVQSAVVRLVMRDVPQVNVMTGNVTQFAIDVTDLFLFRIGRSHPGAELRATQRKRVRLLGGVLLSFLLGAASGALAYRYVGLIAMTAAIVLIAGLIVWLIATKPRRVG